MIDCVYNNQEIVIAAADLSQYDTEEHKGTVMCEFLNNLYDQGSDEKIKQKHNELKIKLESEIKIKTEKKLEIENEIKKSLKTIEETKNKKLQE